MAIITEDTPVEKSLDELEQESQIGEDEQPDEEDEAQDQDEDQDEETDDEDEPAQDESISISIGDEQPEETEDTAAAPPWVKDLRQKHKEMKRQNQELRQQLEQYKPQAPNVGAKPTLASCDYDEDEYQRKTDEWYESKRAMDQQQLERQQVEQQEAIRYRQRIENYREKKSTLKVRDYAEAEATVEDILDATQQTVIIETADNPALVVYALGKNPKRAAQMANEKNPVKFAYELSKLEATLKISKKKPKTTPESKISGTGRISGATDNQLNRLRAEAEKTGDMSKVLAYKRKKRKAG